MNIDSCLYLFVCFGDALLSHTVFRALFRWIIAKDLSKTTKDIIRPNASASILKGVKSGKETYHQLFKKLCRYGISVKSMHENVPSGHLVQK